MSLPLLDVHAIALPVSVMIYGARGSGKSTALQQFVHDIKDRFDVIVGDLPYLCVKTLASAKNLTPRRRLALFACAVDADNDYDPDPWYLAPSVFRTFGDSCAFNHWAVDYLIICRDSSLLDRKRIWNQFVTGCTFQQFCTQLTTHTAELGQGLVVDRRTSRLWRYSFGPFPKFTLHYCPAHTVCLSEAEVVAWLCQRILSRDLAILILTFVHNHKCCETSHKKGGVRHSLSASFSPLKNS